MNLQWIMNPATLYSAMTLTLVSCIGLVLGMKREVSTAKREARAAKESAQGSLEGLAKEIQELKGGFREVEVQPAAPPPADGINLTKRARALRMHRRGETVPTIAAALQSPQNEIRLLLKIHEIVNN